MENRTPKLVSRAEAKKLGNLYYFNGKACKRGHLSPRQTSNRDCLECAGIRRRTEHRRAADRAWRKLNSDRYKKMGKAWRDRPENKEKIRNYIIRSRPKSLGKRASYENARQAKKINALPKWADRDAMRQFYENRPNGFHVDHIVPLNNPLVCGLHVPANLQYLPAKENMSKYNKFEVA